MGLCQGSSVNVDWLSVWRLAWSGLSIYRRSGIKKLKIEGMYSHSLNLKLGFIQKVKCFIWAQKQGAITYCGSSLPGDRPERTFQHNGNLLQQFVNSLGILVLIRIGIVSSIATAHW